MFVFNPSFLLRNISSSLASEMIRMGEEEICIGGWEEPEVCILYNKEHWARSQETMILVLALLRAFCVTLGKSLSFSEFFLLQLCLNCDLQSSL